MKITRARTTIVGTPWRELVFLELETDAGLVGTSEVRTGGRTATVDACLQELAPQHVIGTDPFDVERLVWNIQRTEEDRPGGVAQSALACFEVACWDLMGQAFRVPVWKLLGGHVNERVPAYANGWCQNERDPAKVAALARQVTARGYRGLKLNPFVEADAELDAPARRRAVAIMTAVREAVGADVKIMVEMHGRFTPAAAAAIARLLEPFDPEWIETPALPDNPLAYRPVRHATALPIAAGERAHVMEDLRGFIEGGLVDIVQADLTHFGGLLAMKHLAGWAAAYGLALAPRNTCGPVGTMANLHLAVATPNYKLLEHFNDFDDAWVHNLVDHSPKVDRRDGCFLAPHRPGLGLRLNHELCAKHPHISGRIRLFDEDPERRREG